MVGIAQLVKASDCGPEDRGFDSHYPPHVFVERLDVRSWTHVFCFLLLTSYIYWDIAKW